MRKALMAMIMAATVMTPIAAEAQRRGGDRGEARSERREARQERRESRQETRQQRTAQPQARQAPGWGGSRSDPRMREYRERYDRTARENARRYGSEQQYRDVVQQQRAANRAAGQDRRDGRRDWQRDNRNDRRDWRQDRRDGRRDWQRDNRNDRRDWRQGRRDDRRDWRQDRRADRRDWNRSWRNDRRYDWQRWRNSNRNIFRRSPYYSPYRGWNYRRFSVGLTLQPLFYSQRYWINDPFYYRLPPAPYGTQWVRYYDDVLLVDIYTGEVVDVIYNFFW